MRQIAEYSGKRKQYIKSPRAEKAQKNGVSISFWLESGVCVIGSERKLDWKTGDRLQSLKSIASLAKEGV